MAAETTPALRLLGVRVSVQRKGRSGKIAWASLGLFVLGVVLAFTGYGYAKPHAPVDPMLAAVMTACLEQPFLLLPLALLVRYVRIPQRSVVAVEDGYLVLQRAWYGTRIPLGELTEGTLHPTRGEVEIHRRGNQILRVRVRSATDGPRLLAAAGLDASRRTLRMRLGEVWFLDVLSVFFGGSCAIDAGIKASRSVPFGGVVGAVVFVAVAVAIFRAVREFVGPARVVVGADGVVVEQAFRRRFYPHERIAGMEIAEEHAALRLTSGAVVPIKVRHLVADRRADLATRFEDARRAWRAGEAGGAALAVLDRGGRPSAQWRESLAKVLAEAGAYRARTLTPEDLMGVVESPAAPVERRIGAALALAGMKDEGARARVRIAAEACADTRVRVALEKAAAGDLDDAALEEAVAAERESERAR